MPDYFDYAKGYSSAANLLIKSVLDAEGLEYSVDQFIYPICFNMRHSIELRLKGVVSFLEKISKHREALEDFDLKASHDLGRIWCYIKRESIKLDKRFVFFVTVLDQRLFDVSSVDPTGQTFRYPVDRNNSKHLVEVSIINVSNLYRKFSSLECILDNFEVFCDELVREYDFETHTTKLSRAELLSIAEDIPRRDDWGSEKFKIFKKDTMLNYGLSSNDFNRAVAKIESHYGASPVLDSPSLKYIDISILHAFFEAWCYKSDIVNTRNDKFKEPEVWGFESSNDFLDVMRREAEKDKVVWGILEGAISIEGLVGLLALYDCHGSGYSEEYLKYLDYNERDLLVNVEEGSPGHQYKVLKLVSKPRAGEFILRAIFLLGHHALAEEIIGTHNLAGCFDWLDKARSRELFIEPYKSILAKTLQSCSLG
ncbi:hypothetical protein HBO23_16965 [Pseudomonas sp. WS 5532]|uniref:hypothetical protein n=1 Tax=Pseudomonas sp. WS 5532 TaxID=2717495 RepID=UPI0014751CE2|nr:hypothetical protein [Pseudomonas sp. WS 5532]MCD4726419.1 hypothetical protein [Pirellulales bacterium]NMX74648.1 hypothetical protein [Pseudomonas sp. WS 5532]